jgi:hypothetical protein
MAVRFNDYMIGTVSSRSDAVGMRAYHSVRIRKSIDRNHGFEKWKSMIEHLEDPDKILWTVHVLPSFLNAATGELVAPI